ncbi:MULTISPECIES: flagellar export chaperone FliS [unclassified Serratia (in: enterobacteria)]|uniref:flagellar export chaperone FliS n=1 Tax=unclassified Serratia (in: enterobacteria) TaxID=2647522 RepID=UPI0005084BF3|nr:MULTISPECIES: flagellar export chaperone FliS [unclassified Serratia (in: enterobacteria)]KFK92017.1 flagellar protein FliS [Serratia sp. Ag2]KFK98418.1 flagellar protein FliS [Serratia sp. Ag1]
MHNRSGTQAYAQVSVESSVLSASPHQLIMMLFDGALNNLQRARLLMNQGNIPGKGQAISKAIGIIDNGLLNGLDHEQGGEIADHLAALYDYMKRRLMLANLHNDVTALEEVTNLLENIADAWRQIGSNH